MVTSKGITGSSSVTDCDVILSKARCFCLKIKLQEQVISTNLILFDYARVSNSKCHSSRENHSKHTTLRCV